DGTVPNPPISELLGFHLTEVEQGRAVFEGLPEFHHYNPIGTVHGGFAATMLDSALGCAIFSTRHSRWVFPGQGSWLPKLAIAITVAVGIVSISWTIHGAYDAFPGLLLRELSPLVEDKANLAPLRLVSFLALAVTAAHFVGRDSRVLRWRAAQLIIRCGQH